MQISCCDVRRSRKKCTRIFFSAFKVSALCGGRSTGKLYSTAWHASSIDFGMLRPLTLHMLDVLHSRASLTGLSLRNFLVSAEHQLQQVSNQLGSQTQSYTQPPKHKTCQPLAYAQVSGTQGQVEAPVTPFGRSMLRRCLRKKAAKARTSVTCPPRTCK